MTENPDCPPCELIEFSQLPKPVREGFVACLNGEGSPPLLLSRTRSLEDKIWFQLALPVAGVAGLAALAYLLVADFGESVGGPWQAMAYPLVLFCTSWSILALVHYLRNTSGVPYEQGMYLFPLDLVETVGPYLRLWPTASLKGFKIAHDRLSSFITFTLPNGLSHTLRAKSRLQAEAVVEALDDMKAMQAGMVQDGSTLRDLDPFADARPLGSRNRLEPPGTHPHSHPARQEEKAAPPRTPGSLSPNLVGALCLVTMVAGVSLWMLRLRASDQVMFERAKAGMTTGELRHYLAVGGGFHDKEAQELIPLAALRAARAEGVRGLREFLYYYGDTDLAADAKRQISACFEEAPFRLPLRCRDPNHTSFARERRPVVGVNACAAISGVCVVCWAILRCRLAAEGSIHSARRSLWLIRQSGRSNPPILPDHGRPPGSILENASPARGTDWRTSPLAACAWSRWFRFRLG